MIRRHTKVAELARLPKIADLSNWTASAWAVQPAGKLELGHHDDAVCTLTGTGPYDGLKTKITITSFDLDGRHDEQLATWVNRKVVEEIATALRGAA